MLGAISPLTLGAAATAISTVAQAIPTPGDFAAALRRAGGDTATNAAPNDATTPAPLSRSEFRRQLRALERALGRLRGLEAVETSRPIRLKLDAVGRVRAADDHPDAAKIDALLAANDDLATAIEKLLRSIDARTLPELLGEMSSGGALSGEPTLTYLDGTLTPSLA